MGPPENNREILDELKEAGIKKPAWYKQALPWVLAAGILYWVLKDIDFNQFVENLINAKLWILIPAMLGFSILFAFVDMLSYGLSYRWFVDPEISYKKMAHVRMGSLLFQVLYTPLITLSSVAYLRTHRGAPVSWAISANGFTTFSDLLTITSVLTAAMALNILTGIAPELDNFWIFVMAPIWIGAYVYFRYFLTETKDKYFTWFSKSTLLRAARLGRPGHYFKVYLIRVSAVIGGIAAHWLALYSFGIEVPFPVIAIVAPLIVGGSFLPISGGGFGGPQLIALILLPYADGDNTLIAAYSISFSICFTLGRSIIGAIFLPSYLKDIQDIRPKMTKDPVTGDII
jgi:uncharacterized membrane protein YbhN (UPF0104 family)